MWDGWSTGVVSVRRCGDPLGTRKLHSFQGACKRVFKQRLLVLRKFTQNVVAHLAKIA
jgi:hypothetical protein